MRPIAISLSPNAEFDDVLSAIGTLFSPWRWKEDKVRRVEKEFEKILGPGHKALAVNSGRAAEYLILSAMGIGTGDEVIIQAFTCIAVPNSLLWTGAKAIYADIDDTFNIDPDDLKNKITPKTKAIIIQHTFGAPASIAEIKKIADGKGIFVIEDCAHSLGATYKTKEIGTFGKVAFFSFGRDKVVSSVFGGMITTKDKKLYQKIKKERDKLPESKIGWTVQQLLHPIIFETIILPFYNFGLGKITLGKIALFILQKIGILSKPVYPDELDGKKTVYFPRKMSGALAILALNQLKKLEKFNNHRKHISDLYFAKLSNTSYILPPKITGAIWLRFPLMVKNSSELLSKAKKKGILLGDWYSNVVDPKCDLNMVGYVRGSCPKAEEKSKLIVNLPTYPTLSMGQALKVVKLIENE